MRRSTRPPSEGNVQYVAVDGEEVPHAPLSSFLHRRWRTIFVTMTLGMVVLLVVRNSNLQKPTGTLAQNAPKSNRRSHRIPSSIGSRELQKKTKKKLATEESLTKATKATKAIKAAKATKAASPDSNSPTPRSSFPGGEEFLYFYESKFWGAPYRSRVYLCEPGSQFKSVRISSDVKNRANASALVFQPYGSSIVEPKEEELRRIPWVIDTVESPSHRGFPSGFLDRADYSMTYRMDSDGMDMCYASSTVTGKTWEESLKALTSPVSLESKAKDAPIFWAASNCPATSRRENLVKALMKHINVTNYGPCLNNAKSTYSRGDSKHVVGIPEAWSRKHKFYLAMENSNCDGYLTEKYFKAWPAGVVPIVDGPSTYPSWSMPTNHSIIRADQFESVEELAAFLHKLNNDDDLYRSFLGHRFGEPLNPEFVNVMSGITSEYNPGRRWCNIANKVNLGIKSKRVDLPDTSCKPGKWNHVENKS